MARPMWILAVLGLSLAPACKKRAPATPASSTPEPVEQLPADTTPTEAPPAEPATPAEPEPEPEPQPEPEEDDFEAARRRVNQVLDLIASSDVTKNRQALEKLEQLRAKYPEIPEIDVNIGVVQHKLGNLDAARAAYEAALAKDPSTGEAYLYLGALREQAGDLAGAEAIYREGLARAPDSVAVHIGLVSTLRKQGRYDEAIAQAREALKVNATSPEIYNDVGLAYLAQEDFLLAKFMFRKGLSLPEGEEKAYLHANLGWTYYLEDKIPEATFRLKKAVELDPEYVPGLVYLARVYMEDRNYEDTVGLLERAAARSPKNHGVQMNLGIAYRGVERYEDAKRAYNRALEIDPSNPDPHFNLGILYGDYLKDYDAAVAAFERYKAEGGRDVERADAYIAAVQREKRLVEKRRAREAAAKKRAAEREKQKKLAEEQRKLEEEQARQAAANEGGEQPGSEDATEDQGATSPAPSAGGGSDPWGEE